MCDKVGIVRRIKSIYNHYMYIIIIIIIIIDWRESVFYFDVHLLYFEM